MIEGFKVVIKGDDLSKRLAEIAARHERKATEASQSLQAAVKKLADMTQPTGEIAGAGFSYSFTGNVSAIQDARSKADQEQRLMESERASAIENAFLSRFVAKDESYLLTHGEVRQFLEPSRKLGDDK